MARVLKRAEKLAAKAASRQPAFAAEVARVEALVRAEAAKHTDTGAFAASIHVEHGRIDSHIVSDDPLAWHKEFGHLAVKERSQAARWVPGTFAFTNAARKAVR
ncbi:hypothetical protein HMPREF0058_0749 [Actinomyces urogenitalis DSM 15434]|jgi:hypothetical protein|uniref:HK97 gp10 family phage protein n=1 Tax=Actinomyces urogenitalis DSM 15434 TaxID=525246 RepID=C0W4F5_9ACTO|nr:DUF5403 family protein [Actinomyces urogenitalis]EEH66383.1 hypothetical protein HMPREF0058_0749 [Actinomyces urogenitalis DSM 15434]